MFFFLMIQEGNLSPKLTPSIYMWTETATLEMTRSTSHGWPGKNHRKTETLTLQNNQYNTVELVLKDRTIVRKNMVSPDRWSLVMGSFTPKCRIFPQNWWSIKTGSLSWQWSLKTGFTVYGEIKNSDGLFISQISDHWLIIICDGYKCFVVRPKIYAGTTL